MVNKTEVNELRGVYEEMDAVGKKEMLQMSKKLFDVQRIMDDERASTEKNENIKFEDR